MGKKFAQQKRLLCQPLGALIGGEEVGQLIAKDAGAAGLEHHKGHPGIDLRAEAFQNPQQVLPRLVEEAEIVQRPAAADVLRRDLHLESSRGEHLMRRTQHLGMKVVVPRIRPQQQRGPTGNSGRLRYSDWKLRPANCGNVRCGATPAIAFTRPLTPGIRIGRLASPGAMAARLRPAVHKAEKVVLQRVDTVLVMMAQKLRLPGRHIDVDRALRLARLAG